MTTSYTKGRNFEKEICEKLNTIKYIECKHVG